jgi:hypothetical protein
VAGWERATDSNLSAYAEQWDELIGPIRWHRSRDTRQELVYLYLVTGEDAAGDYPDVGDAELEWRPASSWRSNWIYCDRLWSDALLAEPVASKEPETSGSETVEPPPRLEGTRLADPTVASAATPQYAPRGSYAWPVTFTVTDVQDQWTWVIQKVVFDDGETAATFWEAFPVEPGQAQPTYQDIYQGGPSRLTSGTVRVVGLAQHHMFTTDLPPGMTYGGAALSDDKQVSSSSQPAFWLDDAGAAHNLTFEWTNSQEANTLVAFVTVPNAGTPTFKARHTELDVG